MPRCRAISLLVPALLLIAPVSLPARSRQPSAETSPLNAGAPAPTQAEIRERRAKLIAHQHADDEALNFYERIEHRIDRSGGPNPRVLDDRIFRVVPTGGGTMKILLEDHGSDVSADQYHRQLESWKEVLEMMVAPNNEKGRTARAKYEKRERQRAEFVDASEDAFIPKWLGRQAYAGRTCDVFELLPNPAFHPRSMFEGALAHVTAKIWVDRDADQLVRGEAWVSSDISFVAGIAGKIYRGSKVEMDQAEVSPGIWLPTHYQYNFSGRKFLFPFAEHQTIDVKNYRRIGPPAKALTEVERELANGERPILDP